MKRCAAVVVVLGLAFLSGCLPPGPIGPTPGAALFFDDFEGGRDPAWNSTPYWDVLDGEFYGAGAGCGYAYVTTGVNWANYAVEVDLTMSDSSVGFLVRCQSSLQSYVALEGDYSELHWRVYEDGTQVAASSRIAPGFFGGSQRVKIVVEGSTYTLYVNDLLRSSFVDSRFLTGTPGLESCLWFYMGPEQCSKFDNLRVTAQ